MLASVPGLRQPAELLPTSQVGPVSTVMHLIGAQLLHPHRTKTDLKVAAEGSASMTSHVTGKSCQNGVNQTGHCMQGNKEFNVQL